MKRLNPQLDFDAEARALWARLNLDPATRTTGHWNALDSIYRHPVGGGIIFVGNQTAAENFSVLRLVEIPKYLTHYLNLPFRSHGITRVVNCTHGESKIPDYHKDKLLYYNFPVKQNLSILLFSSHLLK